MGGQVCSEVTVKGIILDLNAKTLLDEHISSNRFRGTTMIFHTMTKHIAEFSPNLAHGRYILKISLKAQGYQYAMLETD